MENHYTSLHSIRLRLACTVCAHVARSASTDVAALRILTSSAILTRGPASALVYVWNKITIHYCFVEKMSMLSTKLIYFIVQTLFRLFVW